MLQAMKAVLYYPVWLLLNWAWDSLATIWNLIHLVPAWYEAMLIIQGRKGLQRIYQYQIKVRMCVQARNNFIYCYLQMNLKLTSMFYMKNKMKQAEDISMYEDKNCQSTLCYDKNCQDTQCVHM